MTTKKTSVKTKNHPSEKPQKTTTKSQLSSTIPLLLTATSSTHKFLLQNDLSLTPTQSLTLESHLSSTYIFLSKLLTHLKLNPTLLPVLPPEPPILTLPHFLTHSLDQDPNWVPLFNLSKPSFTLLLRLLSPTLEKSNLFVTPVVGLGITLFRLAHSASFSAVARRFGVEVNVACRVFYVVVKAIVENLGHLFELSSDLDRVIVGFGWISLPNCCGVLGIERFELENGEGILVQALVDSEGRFLDVSAGWPGEMKPVNVLTSSKLCKGVESKEYLSGDGFGLNEGSEIPQYVLGEGCYPLLSWLLTPFKEEEVTGECEVAFNEVHGRGMGLVETAFERARSRWKIVGRKWKVGNVEAFPFVIVACCLLHNFMIKCSEEVMGESVGGWKEKGFAVFDGEENENGRMVRDELASHLCRVSQRS